VSAERTRRYTVAQLHGLAHMFAVWHVRKHAAPDRGAYHRELDAIAAHPTRFPGWASDQVDIVAAHGDWTDLEWRMFVAYAQGALRYDTRGLGLWAQKAALAGQTATDAESYLSGDDTNEGAT
jgi:hypothetical protein